MEQSYKYSEGDAVSAQEWTFNESELEITNQVLGRGSFGEVKVGRWRGIDVAVKILHDLVNDGGKQTEGCDEEALRSEMAMLSKLRHPNLVLFLGVCEHENRVTSILTELMPCSLYEVLEGQQKRLSLPEILDVASDVTAGLAYLHSHSPTIVHRDISSKNILLGGTRAKIADLGQAKVFGSSASVLSRQTSLPGAMAYSAPEVLTGKYSAKIDVFSFGVLLAQMCSGEYPRIDRREDQTLRAVTNHPSLETLITRSMSYQPPERPAAHEAHRILDVLKSNDRYYPSAWRNGPQRDLGLLGRRWMDDEIHTKTKDVKTALEQTTRRLTAESERLRDEVKRADENEKQAIFMDQEMDELQRRLDMADKSDEQLKDELATQGTRAKAAEEKVAQLTAEVEQCTTTIEELQAEARSRAGMLVELEEENMVVEESRDKLKRDLDTTAEELRLKGSALERTQRTLEMKDRELVELEARLEQILERWKSEKLDRYKETERCKRLTTSGAELQARKDTLEQEMALLEKRLHMYDELPLPDEIKQRFADMEADLESVTATCEGLSSENRALLERNQDLDNARMALQEDIESRDKEIHERDLSILQLKGDIADRDAAADALHGELKDAMSLIEDRDMTISEQKRDMGAIQEDLEASQFECSSLKETIAELKANPGVVDGGGGAISYEETATQPSEGSPTHGIEGDISAEEAKESSGGGTPNAEGAVESEKPHPLAKVAQRQASGALDVFKKGVSRALPPVAIASMSETADDRTEGTNPADETDEERRKRDRNAKLTVQHAIDRNGVIALVKLLATPEHVKNYHVVWRTARAARDIIVKDENSKEAAVARDLDGLLLQGMRSCVHSDVAQAQCLRLLGVLAYGSDIVRRRVGERGGLALLLQAMDRFVSDDTLILHGFTALTNLTHNSIDNRSRFVELQGTAVVCVAMARHLTNQKIQRQACWALLTVAGSDTVSREVVGAGGDRALVNAMMEHRFDSGIQQFGAWALGNLALAGEDVKRRLKIGGVLEVCRIAMESHSDDAEVLRQARHTVGVLGPGGPPKNSIPSKEHFT